MTRPLVPLLLLFSLWCGSLQAAGLTWNITPGQAETIRVPITFSKDAASVTVAITSGEGQQGEITAKVAQKGRQLRTLSRTRTGNGPWKETSKANLLFWPGEANTLEALKADGIAARTCLDKPLMLRIDVGGGKLHTWIEGRLIASHDYPASQPVEIKALLKNQAAADEARSLSHASQPERFERVELPRPDLGTLSSTIVTLDGIPFEVWNHGNAELSLKSAGWPDAKRDPAGFNQIYDGGPYFVGDERTPFTQIPNRNYRYAYLLVRSEEEPDTVSRMTLRLGRRAGGYTKTSQVAVRDFLVDVPPSPTKATGLDRFQVIKVPIHELFPLLIEGDLLDLELTKEVRLARRTPDPNSFRWRPLGLPSNVKVAAITFERSPVAMEVSFSRTGNIAEQGEKPQLHLRLKNTSSEPIRYRLQLTSGTQWHDTLKGELPAGQIEEHRVSLEYAPPGVHPLSIRLEDAGQQLLLRHETTYAILPPFQRQHRKQSPLGISAGGSGKHFTPFDNEATAELGAQLGFHYLSNLELPVDIRRKHGLQQGYVISLRPGNGGSEAILERFKERVTQHPDQLRQLLIFHEDGISGKHATRLPDLFHDRPPYQLNEQERERFEMLLSEARKGAELFRQHHPDVEIQLGNGGLVVREELYRAKFPSELFDSGGNENPTFSRIPETQPPDPIGNNSSLWMDRQMLDHYGYSDKKVTQCHETIYPSTNPGNLTLSTHANYLVRHYLHSLAWRIDQIRGSSLFDKGNSYKNSNWGQTGLFTARPLLEPKPAAAQVATLTYVLDGAVYRDFLDTGSESLYLPRFTTVSGGTLLPYWSVRGSRPLHLTLSRAESVTLISPEGVTTVRKLEKPELLVEATASPAYLQLPAGVEVTSARAGTPTYAASPTVSHAVEVSNLGAAGQWAYADRRNALLENYNPLTPRRKGTFEVVPLKEFEGVRDVLAVHPLAPETGKPTQPMYGELLPKKPVPLLGEPTHLSLQVNGNSGWGRIIVELTDAKGQRWTSIGARSKRSQSPWMADWLGKELASQYEPGEIADWNTDDAWGLSRINFDGWHPVTIPLPGNYPGEHHPWPANSQWRHDQDGVVAYPLTVTSIMVELNEKVLHLTRYAPPRRKEIYLGRLTSLHDERVQTAKQETGERVPWLQVKIE